MEMRRRAKQSKVLLVMLRSTRTSQRPKKFDGAFVMYSIHAGLLNLSAKPARSLFTIEIHILEFLPVAYEENCGAVDDS